MRKLVYYVASTLDGFIAARDGAVDFFPMDEPYLRQLAEEFPETFPTHVRAALGVEAAGTHFDTVVMGRGTYEPALRLGITSPYAHLRQYVVSGSLGPAPDPAVTVVAEDPAAAVRALKAEDTGRDVWLCGGGDLAGQLLDEIDELVVKLNPVAIGEGTPLFAGDVGPRRFALAGSRVMAAGVVLLRYAARPNAEPSTA